MGEHLCGEAPLWGAFSGGVLWRSTSVGEHPCGGALSGQMGGFPQESPEVLLPSLSLLAFESDTSIPLL